ncbi:MAG: DNA-binding response regulator [Bacteroidetes bacterium]|nr:MAG: DNA-binding response regulator [Bacteroidota bacterium]
MSRIRCIAIDDEPLALEVIQKFASKIPSLDLLGCFQNPLEALEFIQQEPVNLIFLDVQMPDLSGLQLKQHLPEDLSVIFTTAYSEYAIESYNLNAVDYLLKPILFDRFLKAVQKAQKLLQVEMQEKPPTYLFIKSDTRYFKVNYDDILYIEGMRDYIAVHTPYKKILTLMSMTKILEKLPSASFMRVHKSFIINLNHISLVQNNRVLIQEREIPISNTYKENFIKFVEASGI